jgi:hypothetical protein
MNTIATPPQKPLEKPWYKQFWPWFLIALPAAAVIASFITLDIAITHADIPVQGDYVQHGLTVLHKDSPHETSPHQATAETPDTTLGATPPQ